MLFGIYPSKKIGRLGSMVPRHVMSTCASRDKQDIPSVLRTYRILNVQGLRYDPSASSKLSYGNPQQRALELPAKEVSQLGDCFKFWVKGFSVQGSGFGAILEDLHFR